MLEIIVVRISWLPIINTHIKRDDRCLMAINFEQHLILIIIICNNDLMGEKEKKKKMFNLFFSSFCCSKNVIKLFFFFNKNDSLIQLDCRWHLCVCVWWVCVCLVCWSDLVGSIDLILYTQTHKKKCDHLINATCHQVW